jgi:hypothetical protein
MAARDRLPAAPGDRIRVEPYRISLRTQYARPEWRAVASAYTDAAQAWRRELNGYDYWSNRGVVSFECWRRLRDGQPETFAAYEDARTRAIAQPTDHPRDLADKIQLVAEVLGVADPRQVGNCWPEDVPAGGWTLADRLFAILWNDAHNVARRVEADREKARKKGKR